MKQNKDTKPRLLARTLARELTPEELEATSGASGGSDVPYVITLRFPESGDSDGS